MKKLTQEDFVKKSIEKHGNEYDYSKSIYINKRTKVEIICPIHGSFFQLPETHYGHGSGCPKCAIIKKTNKRKLSTEEVVNQFKKIHGSKYDYSKINYLNTDTPVEIICPTHGSFFQTPYEHKKGSGCPKCSKTCELTTEEFVKRAKEVHGNKYDYSLVDYKNTHTKVKIICLKHGVFEQTFINHVSLKQNCPKCAKKIYKGEEKIELFLRAKKLDFETQKRFTDCKDKRCLPFDFHVPSENLLIEYDGIEHFTPIGFGGNSEKNYNETKKHDQLKDEYCKNKGIKLLRISYEEFDNIEEILQKSIQTTRIKIHGNKS